jgi:hypothetical protein
VIEPVLPPGLVQAAAGKAERPLIAIAVLSLPKALAVPAQQREIGGTITQAAADGSAVLHTAAGDIAFKASVALTAGKTATLHLMPAPAGLAAAIQFNGAVEAISPTLHPAHGGAVKPAVSNAAIAPSSSPLNPSASSIPSSTGLRDAAVLLSQLVTQAELPVALRPAPADPVPAATLTLAGGPANPSPTASPAIESKPLRADAAGLALGLLAALKRPAARLDEGARRDGKDRISGTPPDTVYRASAKSEPQDQLVWRQLEVVDENRIVPMFLGRRPPEDETEHAHDEAPAGERLTRFTIRFDLEHAGPVRIDSVYGQRRLEMLLTLEASPDAELQTMVRERLAALSDEFGLSISLKIGAPAAGIR